MFYRGEIWSLTLRENYRLRMLEDELIMIKPRRMRWIGHVEGMRKW
jgi:hypothetical protein